MKIQKKLYLFIFSILIFQNILAQNSGNINYNQNIKLSETDLYLDFSKDELIIQVKGVSNIKADNYVAVFSVTQLGKTAKEVNELINTRINSVKTYCKSLDSKIVFYTDMISFVPMYEYEVEKKVFNKKTYNEIPIGFEIKKNIHINYTNTVQLDAIISVCAENEIYDLVRVDYFVSDMEKNRKEMTTKANLLLNEKIKYYESILNMDFTNSNKIISDNFATFYPVESYQSYKAYSSSSIEKEKRVNVNDITKSMTMYYMPKFDKNFDFVINPVIVEPVVQLVYQINMKIKFEKEKQEVVKQENFYYFITPNGELKKMDIK